VAGEDSVAQVAKVDSVVRVDSVAQVAQADSVELQAATEPADSVAQAGLAERAPVAQVDSVEQLVLAHKSMQPIPQQLELIILYL